MVPPPWQGRSGEGGGSCPPMGELRINVVAEVGCTGPPRGVSAHGVRGSQGPHCPLSPTYTLKSKSRFLETGQYVRTYAFAVRRLLTRQATAFLAPANFIETSGNASTPDNCCSPKGLQQYLGCRRTCAIREVMVDCSSMRLLSMPFEKDG